MTSRRPRRAKTLLIAVVGAVAFALAAPGAGHARPGDQQDPAIAFDGTNFLVAWRDLRDDPKADIYGARISPAGGVIDRAGIAIATGVEDALRPAVAFDGMNYLVVWDTAFDLYGVRLSTAGHRLGSFPISRTSGRQLSPDLAFDGTNYLVVWSDNRGGSDYDVYAARVSPAGVVLDPNGVAVSTAPANQQDPHVSFDGTNYLIVWDDFESPAGEVKGARVSPAGQVLDSSPFTIATGARHPDVAFDGTNHLVTWDETFEVRGARVSPAGSVLDPGGLLLSTTAAALHEDPALAFDGTNYLVAWRDGAETGGVLDLDVGASRVSTAGLVLDPAGIAVSSARGNQHSPAVAFGAGAYLLAWEDNRTRYDSDIFATRVSLGGAVLDPGGIPIPRARDMRPPRTRITSGLRGRQIERRATFRFRSSEAGSSFRCRLDSRLWRSCASPRTYRHLSLGRHILRVRARDRSGNLDSTPAVRRWRVAEPIRGRLVVVPGRNKRSGPGPLRRYLVEVEEGINGRAVAKEIDRILADRRGWGGSGRVSFKRVSSGSVSFRITLASPNTVDRLCWPLNTQGVYSCAQAGRAILNLRRWRAGAAPFRTLTSYRAHLVNHEVGHLLGHGHYFCRSAGARAPVMAQQTISLGGCRANSWPLLWERG